MSTNAEKTSFLLALLEFFILWAMYAVVAVYSVLYILAFFVFVWGWSVWTKQTGKFAYFWMRGAAFLFLLAGTQRAIVYVGGPAFDLVEWGTWVLTVILFALPLWFCFVIQQKLGYLSHNQLFSLAKLSRNADITPELNSFYRAQWFVDNGMNDMSMHSRSADDFGDVAAVHRDSPVHVVAHTAVNADSSLDVVVDGAIAEGAESIVSAGSVVDGAITDGAESIVSDENVEGTPFAHCSLGGGSNTKESSAAFNTSTDEDCDADDGNPYLCTKDIERIKKYIGFCAFMTDSGVRQGVNALSLCGLLFFFYFTFELTQWTFAGIGVLLLFGISRIAQGIIHLVYVQ